MSLPIRSVSASAICLIVVGLLPSTAGARQGQVRPTLASGVSGGRAGVAATGRATPFAATAAYVLEQKESALQAGLSAAVRRLGFQRMVDEGRMSVAVVDLATAEPRYAALNGNRMMYAASMPKIAILLGAFDALARGDLQDTRALRDEMTRMIRVSSNTAATSVLRKVGFENVAATLMSPLLRLYDPTGLGGLWIGKAYGEGQYWRRDPIANLSHGATARQTARFFVMLDRGELVSPAASAAMKEMLGNPGINHKFVRGLAARPGARIFRKSGSWRQFHADAALIERDDARYVVVGIVQDAQGERVLQRLAVAVDDLVRRQAPSGTAVAR